MKQSTLGSCIRTLRLRNHLTQAQLARKLGVTDKAVSKWERDLSYPDIALFPKLSEVLGSTVNDLLTGCKEEYRPSNLVQAFELSQDIRTPLHVILGFVEIAKHNYGDQDMMMWYLEGIKVSGEYLMSLLNCIMQHGCCSADAEEAYKKYFLNPEEWEKYLLGEVQSRLERQEDYDFSGKRILIVDDMMINRDIAAAVLRQTGAETETAEDGTLCVQKVEAMPAGYYDLILMDIIMPDMDGLEATRRIRRLSDQEKAQVPIIAMTTNVSDKGRKVALDAGMNAFTEKPILVDKLFMTMSRYLAGGRTPCRNDK